MTTLSVVMECGIYGVSTFREPARGRPARSTARASSDPANSKVLPRWPRSGASLYAGIGIPMSALNFLAASASNHFTRAMKLTSVGLCALAWNMFFKLLTTFL